MPKSESEKALRSIKVTDKQKKNHPTTWPECERAEQAVQRRYRNAQIYRDYYKFAGVDDESRELAIQKQVDKWHLTTGRIEGIIKMIDEDPDKLPVEMRSQADGMRLLNLGKVNQALLESAQELEFQRNELCILRDSGEKWVEIEEIDESGDRGKSVKTKKIAIGSHLLTLNAKISQLYSDLYKTLRDVSPPREDKTTNVNINLGVDKAFTKMFERNRDHNKEVDADFEEVKE